MTNIVGNLWILSAPSGAGKTSLVKALLQASNDIVVAISHTTRAPRAGEKNGVSYYFVTEKEFNSIEKSQGFYEHAKVFGNYYGTSKQEVDRQLQAGKDVILEIDWQGAQQIRNLTGALSIFILPPSLQSLKDRLEARGEDSQKVIIDRMLLAQNEIFNSKDYDYLVVNDDFDTAVTDLQSIIKSARYKATKQRVKYKALLDELLSTR